MFVSHRLAEVKGAQAPVGEEYLGWHFVEKIRLEPWFHVTAVRPFQEDSGCEIILISTAEMLKIFLETFNETYKMTSVQVVTPGWLNGSKDWAMEPLAELSESDDGVSLRYTTRDGRQYFFPGTSPTPESDYRYRIYPAT